MLGDGDAEGLPELRILYALIQRRLGDTNAARGDVDAAQFQPAEGMFQPLPFHAADQAVGRDAVIVEHKFRAVDALVAKLFELPADRESGAFFRDEQGHATMARFGARVGFDQ